MVDAPQPELPDDASGSITILYRQWRKGEGAALDGLIARFRPRLLALARSTLAGRVSRIADAEDAFQSAIISFWERVEAGGLDDELDRDDLWNVVGLITVRKALKLQAREHTAKRGAGRVVSGVPLENTPDPDSSIDPDLQCAELLELLEDDLRPFAVLRLMGYKNREIAAELGCTERKVERKLQLVRAVWEEEMARWQA